MKFEIEPIGIIHSPYKTKEECPIQGVAKPDGVGRGLLGEVVRRFEKNGLKIAAMKMVKMSKEEAQGFYAVHRGKPFYDSLTDFMSSGPAVVMVLEGEGAIAKNRELMGATNYKEAAPGTIRADFATDIEKNVVHGSDSPESAALQIPLFFEPGDLCDYDLVAGEWILSRSRSRPAADFWRRGTNSSSGMTCSREPT